MPYFILMLIMVLGVAITTFGITTWVHVQGDRSAAARKAAADAEKRAQQEAPQQERELAAANSR